MTTTSVSSLTNAHYIDETKEKPKSCSLSFGRSIKTLASAACTVAKVVGVSLLTLGLFSGAQAVSIVIHDRSIAHTSFRPYITRFVHPGEQVVRNGTMACDIRQVIDTQIVCEKNAAKVFEYIQKNDSGKPALPPRALGYTIDHDTGRSFKYHMDPAVYENFKNATQFVENTFFQEKSPLEISSEQTVQYILDLHRYLIQGLLEEELANPGTYRQNPRYYGSENNVPIYKKNAELLPENERILFEGLFKKLEHSGLIRIQSPEERAIWKKVGLQIAPDYTTIAAEMKSLGDKIIERIHNGVDAIDLAAYVHIELSRITPFSIANGRLARILVNAILVRYGGVPPVVFPSHPVYVQAVEQAVTKSDYKIFANYLRHSVIPWVNAMQGQLKAFHSPYPTKFTDNMPLFMNPGFLVSPKGNHLCSLAEESQDEGVSSCSLFDEKRLQRYKNAVQVVEETILQNPLAFTDTARIIFDIREIHAKLSSSDYRTTDTPSIGVHSGAINARMALFAQNLQVLLEKRSDYVTIASWAHTELMRILPFEKDNEELARLILIAIIRRYTPYNHVIFVHREEYYELTQKAVDGDLEPFVACVKRALV